MPASIDRAVRGVQVDSPMVPLPSISVMSLFPFPVNTRVPSKGLSCSALPPLKSLEGLTEAPEYGP